MKKIYNHITLEQRKRIKMMLDNQQSVSAIAANIGVNQSTIYREIKRGNDGGSYNPELAELSYRDKLREKGRNHILSQRPDLADFISECILKDKLSPERIAQLLEEEPRFNRETISKTTIYHAIDCGLIPGVTRDNLQTESTKMYSDGLIRIPNWIREKYGFADGDVFKIEILKDENIILKRDMDEKG